MGRIKLEGLQAIHVNLPFVAPTPFPETPTAEEQIAIDQCLLFANEGSYYHHIQTTRPQTIGYSLVDSPVGLAAWIYEKLGEPLSAPSVFKNLYGIHAVRIERQIPVNLCHCRVGVHIRPHDVYPALTAFPDSEIRCFAFEGTVG
ncbi:hypothetical protein P3T23_001548 [Paraburkholderia sp. GAS448]